MKTSNKIFQILCLAFAIALFPNCGDDDPGTGNPNIGNGTVSAKVDGSNWSSSDNNPHSSVGAVGTMITDQNIIIQGWAADGSHLSVSAGSITAILENTPYTDTTGLIASYQSDFGSSDVWTSVNGGTGTVTFSNISSTNVTGTFSFVGKHATQADVTITEGVFDIDL